MGIIKVQTDCPGCHTKPLVWRECAQLGSRELFWIGCHLHQLLAGGNTLPAAKQLWGRIVSRWKFNHHKAA